MLVALTVGESNVEKKTSTARRMREEHRKWSLNPPIVGAAKTVKEIGRPTQNCGKRSKRNSGVIISPRDRKINMVKKPSSSEKRRNLDPKNVGCGRQRRVKRFYGK